MPLTPTMVATPAQLAEAQASPRRAVGGGRTKTDQEITPELALTVPAVLAAFTVLAEDISSLPLILYERTRKGERERAYDQDYYSLMHDAPNPEHSSMIWRELKIGHLLAWGNFYAQIIVDKRGKVAELWPLRPDRMTVARVDGQRIYTYLKSDGRPRVFLQDELLHIPAFGFDGLLGYSRIALARNAIGLAMSTETFGSKFFANDARPGTVLKHPGTLSDTAYQRLRESWESEHKGAENSHRSAILEEGLDVHEIGIPPEDAQFIETQHWTVAQIARVFRVPPHMIGDVERSTSWGSGIDSQEQGYVTHTLRPWTVRTEQALGLQLLLPAERKRYFWEHLFDGLLRGDIATRYAAYVQAINNGIMSPNEAREKENMNPYAGGEVYRVPLNTTPASAAAAAVPQAKIGPLLVDAATRILRRETAEHRDAQQRWLAKGQAEKFNAWLERFYKQDLPEFAAQVLTPIEQAGLIEAGRIGAWIAGYCSDQGELVLMGATPAEPDELESRAAGMANSLVRSTT